MTAALACMACRVDSVLRLKPCGSLPARTPYPKARIPVPTDVQKYLAS